MVEKRSSFGLIAPYALWMVLMHTLPNTPMMYVVRSAAVFLLLLMVFSAWVRTSGKRSLITWRTFFSVLLGVVVGIAVFAIWVLPEYLGWQWYDRFCILGSSSADSLATAPDWQLIFRLFGSAFVIAVAEELFFRKWVIGFAGFWWMVALFAVEHNRWLVAAIAGAIYGILYLRCGIKAAIAAHVTTNFILGLWVIFRGQWQFW